MSKNTQKLLDSYPTYTKLSFKSKDYSENGIELDVDKKVQMYNYSPTISEQLLQFVLFLQAQSFSEDLIKQYINFSSEEFEVLKIGE